MSKVSLREYTNESYDPGPFWKRALWMLISRIVFETTIPWPSSFKAHILRAFGSSVGDGVVLKPSLKIKYPWFLSIGQDCWIGEEVWIDNVAAVEMAGNVVLSQGAYLLTGNHDYKSRRFDLMAKPIKIEEGAWIAAKAIVTPGVTVGEHAVLAVGSVAGGELEKWGIYRGNPAEKVRERSVL